MVDISDDTKIVRRRGEVTGVVRRLRWSEAKGRIVAEVIAPGAVIADVARRHDIAAQQLWYWIRAARAGRFVLPGDGLPAFVPVITLEPGQTSERAQDVRSPAIELMIGAVTVRVPAGAEARDVEAVSRRSGGPIHERRPADPAGACTGAGGDEARGLPRGRDQQLDDNIAERRQVVMPIWRDRSRNQCPATET
jgi:transposase